MAISHRLHSPMDIRPDNDIDEPPKRIVFLSVEGNRTEADYFNYIEKYKNQLGIHSLVHVETLSRRSSDTCSDPEKVYELLQDYLKIREEGILPEDIHDILSAKREEYSTEYIKKFLEDKLPPEDTAQLKSAIQLAGIDIDYQKFLHDYQGTQGTDVFAVVIDRDKGNHAEESLRELMRKCAEKHCHCFLTNPCFEFWLLLHLCDVHEDYCEKYHDLLENAKVSGRHTFVSYEVSQKAGHAKKMPENKFKTHYLNTIDYAITNASAFTQEEEALLNNLGSNLPKLFSILREPLIENINPTM